MTDAELREIHIPDGCHLVKVYDQLDQGGPIVKLFERDKTPEEAERVKATIQRVLNEVHTANCIRRAHETT